MAPMVGVFATSTITTAGVHDIDVSYIQTWVDDPASDSPADGSTIAASDMMQSPKDTSLNLVKEGDIAEYYQVSSSTEFVSGMLISARGPRRGIRHGGDGRHLNRPTKHTWRERYWPGEGVAYGPHTGYCLS
jgi:hypothetical protein